MGGKLFGVFVLFFLTLAFVELSYAGVGIDRTGDLVLALELAAQAGVSKWDKEATAEAGLIVLDEAQAVDMAYQNFVYNTQELDIDSSQLQVQVVNHAPVTLVVDGEALHFASNGLIVSYETFVQVASVDDR